MKRILNFLKIILPVLFVVQPSVPAQVSIFSTDELQATITDHGLSIDFILIDVRDNDAVRDGIIASIFCKPYHLPWNDSTFHRHYHTIPTGIPVMIYDQTGTYAMQAARILAENNYEVVAAIAGGVNAYQGTLADTSFLNALELLSQPSYTGDLSGTVQELPTPRIQSLNTSTFTFRKKTTVFPNGRSLPLRNIRQSASGCLITRNRGTTRKSVSIHP